MSKDIPVDEGVGIVDTDFASEPHSNMSDSDGEFWEDLEERRVKAGVAAKAWVTVGLAWRSPDVSECGTYEMVLTGTLQYVAYLRWLAFAAHKARRADQEGSIRGMGASAQKRRRTTGNNTHGFKKDYDAPPSKLSERPPSSLKSKPYRSMIAGWWLEQNPEFGRFDDGGEWLVGFRSRLKEGDLHELDLEHLEELTAWHEEQEMEMERERQREKEKENRGGAETQPLAGPSSLTM
jgi:hypothetical protein